MNFQRAIKKAGSAFHFFKGKAKLSYSQFGEDILVDYVFRHIYKKEKPSYLDIGTNDPVMGNNTYLFYTNESPGVCVEPDPVLVNRIKSKRGRDTILHAGVGIGHEATGTLYTFPEAYTGWNTFSQEEAQLRKRESGVSFTETRNIPFIPVNSIFEKYFDPYPDFISIDVEGLDLAILRTINFDKFKPLIFCIETAAFSVNHTGGKNNDIINFLLGKGYIIYADTYINTIFVRKDILNR